MVRMVAITIVLAMTSCSKVDEKIGVFYVIHGSMDENKPEHMWNASVQQFAYDHNHSVYKLVIWNPDNWCMVLDTEGTTFAREYLMKYDFQYPRIGGVDPNQASKTP